jgi:hypothetical protein
MPATSGAVGSNLLDGTKILPILIRKNLSAFIGLLITSNAPVIFYSGEPPAKIL